MQRRIPGFAAVLAAIVATAGCGSDPGDGGSSSPGGEQVTRVKVGIIPIVDHPDEARRILTTYTKIKGDVLEELILPGWPPDVDLGSLRKLASLGERDGLFGNEKRDLDALFS